jgi:hypothetical protein
MSSASHYDGQDRINSFLDNNLQSSTTDPPSITFEDIIVSWFQELLLGDNQAQANNKTVLKNQIFQD